MSLDQNNIKPAIPTTSKSNDFWRKNPPLYLDIICFVIWIFAVIKLFILDIDVEIINFMVPSAAWVLRYKFVFFLGCFVFIVTLVSKLKKWRFFWYLVFWPLIMIVWRLPKAVILSKSLMIIVGFLFFVIWFGKSIKRISSILFVLLVCALFCIFSTNKSILYLSIISSLLILGYILISQVIREILSSKSLEEIENNVVNMHNDTLIKFDRSVARSDLALAISGPEAKIVRSNIESAILTNTILIVAANVIRKYKISGFPLVFGCISVISSILLTTMVFCFIYFAVAKIDPRSFSVNVTQSPFILIAISFKSMIFSSVDGVLVTGSLALAANITENIFAIVIVAIFGSIIVSSTIQNKGEQLDRIIRVSEAESKKIEEFLLSRYDVQSLDVILEALQQVKSATLIFIFYLTSRMKGR